MENLKKIRKERNLTQADVAKSLDITVSAYGNYELGQRSPSPEILKKLSKLFNVSVDFLLDCTNINSHSHKDLFNYIQKLKERKKELKFTYNKISELSGVPRTTVTNIFCGYVQAPRIDTLNKIAITLQMPTDDLFPQKFTTSSDLPSDKEKLLMFYDEIGQKFGVSGQKMLLSLLHSAVNDNNVK